jgi:hypothetical protein
MEMIGGSIMITLSLSPILIRVVFVLQFPLVLLGL